MKNIKNLIGVASLGAALTFSGCQLSEEEVVLNDNFETAVPVIGATEQNGQIIPGKYIVVFHSDKGRAKGMNPSYISELAATRELVANKALRYGLKESQIGSQYASMVKGFAAELTDNQLQELQADPDVKYIEMDRVVALGPPPGKGPGGGGGGGSTSQQVPYGITRVNGGVNYTGSSKAYVVDSGIDLDHPDLNVDASAGFNAFTSGKDGKSMDDGNGHGTHVAGTIAAIDNNQGVIGVAAGATVVPIKVLDSRGSGSYSGVIAGIDFVGATGNAGDVANLSLGGPASQAVDDAVFAASQNGIDFVLAAGNESTDANNSSPARVNGPNIYTISSMDSNDNWSSFSNYGNPPVDYCAPGSGVLSTYPGGYATLSGTSMASPHVAGILLLGNVSNGGTVNGDPDGNPDTIATH